MLKGIIRIETRDCITEPVMRTMTTAAFVIQLSIYGATRFYYHKSYVILNLQYRIKKCLTLTQCIFQYFKGEKVEIK